MNGFLGQSSATQLPEAMMPAHFSLVKDMPMTATGKIDRQALPDPVLGMAALSGELPSRPSRRSDRGCYG